MITFNPQQIENAYQNLDPRVADALSSTDIDGTLTKLRATLSLDLSKLETLRTYIDFTVIGLLPARSLTKAVADLFPSTHQAIVEILNKEIFRPVLDYVRMAPKYPPTPPPNPKTPLSQPQADIYDANVPDKPGTIPETMDIPVKPVHRAVDPYREMPT